MAIDESEIIQLLRDLTITWAVLRNTPEFQRALTGQLPDWWSRFDTHMGDASRMQIELIDQRKSRARGVGAEVKP